ncbi:MULTISPECIES: aminotransferase class IV [unclassified Nitratiruptor]|uniref:aminotransferase class IV n=1 Tax=unclassified Nitratiruptor TaxID=2624044 RepID=UPI001915C7E2|nr:MULTISPECIES: aminotransferase class IV [unclassified Nitratiruptor]BCD60772.1 4-amino-4-deoxychorismate lyase [Nitratiruptor sp. YY08-10]BCD64704.1 4-amino-4-deoxychorismate lyase [Nitratiruptor sp. YY08-14]
MAPLFFETVRIKDGEIYHIHYHNLRLNTTMQCHFPGHDPVDLRNYIDPPKEGLYRCKITYSNTILSVEYFPYIPKSIRSFTIIPIDFEYSFKYLDRKNIEKAIAMVSTDDAIFVKDGLLTDTSIANIAFLYKKSWITPKKPLLFGTTRMRFIEARKLQEADIEVDDLEKFEQMAIMNAMIDFVPLPSVTIQSQRRIYAL